VPLSVGLEQTATLWALGPAWCFPLRRGRVEVYVLAGAVQTITTVMEPEYDSGWLTWSASWPYGLPKGSESEAAPLVIVGSSWSGGRARLWRFGFGFEVGAELQMTGQAPALDDPPIQFDGAHYELRTRSVPPCASASTGSGTPGSAEAGVAVRSGIEAVLRSCPRGGGGTRGSPEARRVKGYPTEPSDPVVGLDKSPITGCTPVRIRVPPPDSLPARWRSTLAAAGATGTMRLLVMTDRGSALGRH
jgi:hypothetical protein